MFYITFIQIIFLFLRVQNLEYKESIIKGFPRYIITNEGNIKSLITNKILKPQICGIKSKQYLKIALCEKGKKPLQVSISRLVGIHFIPNPENKATINHKDFNRFNNFEYNLEWATYEENEQHKILAGRNNKAKGGSHTKARKIYQYSKDRTTFIKEFDCLMDVAREFNLSNAKTCSIIRVCKNKKHANTAYGYFWSYTKLELI